ncbi:MAG: AAA family ATPase, partial [Planctomycetota bacterium]
MVDIPPPSTASARSTDPGSFDDDERRGDDTIRPDRLEEFIGQQQVTDNLRVYIEAARRRREALDHILLSGMPGLGKTTLASLVAHEYATGYPPTSG